MLNIIVVLIFVVLLGVMLNIYFSWVARKCPPPIAVDCPPCPKCPPMPVYPDPSTALLGENKNLKSMVRYLTLVLKKFEAEKELYKLSHGYHQVYNSPKMDYLKKEIRRMIQQIKGDPDATIFFERHLNGVLT
jgi:hypothetical protein